MATTSYELFVPSGKEEDPQAIVECIFNGLGEWNFDHIHGDVHTPTHIEDAVRDEMSRNGAVDYLRRYIDAVKSQGPIVEVVLQSRNLVQRLLITMEGISVGLYGPEEQDVKKPLRKLPDESGPSIMCLTSGVQSDMENAGKYGLVLRGDQAVAQVRSKYSAIEMRHLLDDGGIESIPAILPSGKPYGAYGGILVVPCRSLISRIQGRGASVLKMEDLSEGAEFPSEIFFRHILKKPYNRSFEAPWA